MIVLDNHKIKGGLSKYVKILRENFPTKCSLSKKIAVDFVKTDKLKDLWDLHSTAVKKFYRIQNKIENKELDLTDLEDPKKNLLDLKIFLADKLVENCDLCEWMCHVNRKKEERGFCKVKNDCIISSEFTHLGEESYFVPSYTVFFWSCNMLCIFCQNYQISHRLKEGKKVTPEFLGKQIKIKKREGCKNVNFVGGEPTPYLPWILKSLKECKVNIPVIWNSNMYLSEKAMNLLKGIVDVYLTDFKFGPGNCSEKLTKVNKYWEVVTRNHINADKQAEVVIRHLILPNHIDCCSIPILEWISENMEKSIVNIMKQYFPSYLAKQKPNINRKISREEYQRVLTKAKELNIITKN